MPWAVKSISEVYSDTGPGRQKTSLTSSIRGPTRDEGILGILPGTSDSQSSPLPLCHRGGPIE